MIIAKIIGGLGNQMFQLAFAEVMRQINTTDLFLDTSEFISYSDRQYDLDCFEIDYSMATPQILRRFQETAGRKQKLLKLIAEITKGKGLIIKEKELEHFKFSSKILQKYRQDLYLEGYRQSYKYFTDYEKDIRKLFTFRESLNGENLALFQKTQNQETIALHIRRGDYIQNQVVNKIHGVCSMEYYQKAIETIASKITNPHFLIFSDDITWCKSEIRTGFEQTFVDFPNKNWEDMQLMSLCKHQIIANSSFSWWGAWLNSNPKKVVISPEKWLSGKNINTKDLLPENWIKI